MGRREVEEENELGGGWSTCRKVMDVVQLV